MPYISKTYRNILTAGLLTVMGCGSAFAQDIMIQDATLITNTDTGRIASGDILIKDGKIVAMGNISDGPAGMQVINAKGKWVTPGLFASFSRLGLVEISGEARTNDISASSAKTSVSNLAADSFNPKSPVIGNTRIEGITHVASAPGTGETIFGGIGLIANTSGEFNSVENRQAFVFVSLGESGAETAGGSRSAAMAQLRAALNDAAAYPARYGGPDDGDALPRADAAALYKAARGQMPLIISADRAVDLLSIITLKQELNLDIIIAGAAEGWMVANELKAAGIKVMVDPQENLPGNFDSVGARLDNVILLDEAGVDYAITTRSAGLTHNIRVLSQHAGNAVGAGLSWDKAFAAISSTPARWFGTKGGTIKRGDIANLVIWDGDPLEVTSGAEQVFINGQAQDMRSRQSALSDRYNPTSQDTRPHKYR